MEGNKILLFVYFIHSASALSEPLLVWTQRAHKWTTIRGIKGDPSQWLSASRRTYVNSESVEGFRYCISYDHVRSFFYWTDMASQSIVRQPLDDTLSLSSDNKETVFADPTSNITATAIDWLAGNIYYTDSENKLIGVATSNVRQQNMHRILFNFDLNGPHGITLDPQRGYLFWSDVGPNAKIERSSLTGTDRRIIADTGCQQPLGMVVDLEETRVYWVDRDRRTIESVSYSGEDRLIFESNQRIPYYFGITLYNDYLFASNEKGLQIQVFDKSNGDLIKKLDIDALTYHITIAQDTPADPKHECMLLGCEHICFNRGDKTGICTCMQGYYLELDGTTCTKSMPRYIYSIGDRVLDTEVEIDVVHPKVIGESQHLLASGFEKVQGVGFHYEKELVYLSDTVNDAIYSVPVEGGQVRELTVQTKLVLGIGVDWLANKVYWVDHDLNHMMVFEMDGRYHSILQEDLVDPGALSVDSVHRVLFWSERNTEIWRSNLDGTDPRIIVNSDVSSLKGLVVDPRTQRVYWTDDDYHQIVSSNFEGRSQKTITLSPSKRVYDVTVFQDYMTWTEGEQALQFTHIQTGKELDNVNPDEIASYNDSYDVITYDVYLQPNSISPCGDGKGDCQHHCFPITRDQYRCGCALGFSLANDSISCISEPTSSLFILYVDPYHKQVYQQSILEPMDLNPQGLPLPLMDYPISVDYDQTDSKVYWIDRTKGVIMGCALDGSDSKILRRIGSDSLPLRLALDSASRHLFYIDEILHGIFRINMPDGGGYKKIVGGSDILSLAVDPIKGRVYYTSANSVWYVERKGGTATKVLDILDATALSMRPMEQVLYIGLKNGSLYSVVTNLTDPEPSFIAHVPDAEVYAVAAGSADIYFTAWNKKGVYRVNTTSAGSATVVSYPVFARLTDIKIFETIIPLPVVATPPDMMTIGIILGVVLLILLLALIFGLLLRRKRKKRTPPGSTSSGDNLYVENNTSSEDMGFSNDFMKAPPVPSEPTYTEPVSQAPPNFDPPSDPYPELTAAGIVITSGVKTIDKKKFKKKKNANGAPPPPPKTHKPAPTSSSEFELTQDMKVATVIHRLANRLRNRLSSVRFSGPVETPDVENGEPEENVDYLPPPVQEKAKQHIEVPDKPHLMPRGYAPASHNVPRVVRTTWGKAKANAELQKNADDGNKFGMQI